MPSPGGPGILQDSPCGSPRSFPRLNEIPFLTVSNVSFLGIKKESRSREYLPRFGSVFSKSPKCLPFKREFTGRGSESMFFRCYFSEIGVEEVGVCVARHTNPRVEKTGGQSLLSSHGGKEESLRSAPEVGGSGLSRPGLSHGLTLAS